MAVQIPRIERVQAQPTQNVAKSNVSVPDINRGANLQMQAVGKIVEDQADYFLKQEKAAIDTAAKAASNEYSIYLNSELNNAKLQQGDPTAAYASFNENMNLKYEEILNKNPNLSEAGKQAVRSSLNDVMTNYSMKANTAYSGQYFDYDKKVTNDAVKMTAQDFSNAASYIDPKDEKSFQAIDALINRIGNLYKAHGEKFGAVTRDENGNQISTDGINLQIAQATSEGLSSAINNLNASNRPDLAEALYAKYYKYIEINKQDNLTKSISKTKDNIEVYDAVDATRAMSPEAIDSYLNKKFKDNSELKSKAYDLIVARKKDQEAIKDLSSEKNYDIVAKMVMDKMNSYLPYKNLTEMQLDPSLAGFLPKITNPRQLKALNSLVSAPKESSSESLIKFNQAFMDGELRGMSPTKFLEYKAGMSKADQKVAEREWRKFNAPETTAQEAVSLSRMAKNLQAQLIENGYIQRNSYGKIIGENEKKYIEAFNEFKDALVDLPPNMTNTERDKFVREFAAKKIKEKAFNNSGFNFGSLFGGQTQPKKQEVTNPFKNVETLNDRKRNQDIFSQFKKEKGRAPKPGSNELQDFIKEKGL